MTTIDTGAVPTMKSEQPVRGSVDVAPTAWLMFVIGILGLAVDATLAKSVFNLGFGQDDAVAYVLAVIFGLIAAKVTTDAAIHYNSGKRSLMWICLVGVLLLGLGLAWARLVFGVTEGPDVTTATATQVQTLTYDEVPATALMLILYVVSMVGVFFSALKIFHPARQQLKAQDRRRRKLSKELAPLEADYVAIHERLANADAWRRELTEQRAHVMAELEARESSLKNFCRVVIARELGDPSATPLVRAPHQPTQ